MYKIRRYFCFYTLLPHCRRTAVNDEENDDDDDDEPLTAIL